MQKLLLLLVTIWSLIETTQACAPAPPPNVQVDIATESAIIIWDPTTKTQHFIRRASFVTPAKDFGFLVPTPTKPTLAEASDDAFVYLRELTKPRVITQSRPMRLACSCTAMDKSMGAQGVTVLEEKRVAGYDAVILQASDSNSLQTWLQQHGYTFPKNLVDWVNPYVEAGWKISAFKIAKTDETNKVSTSAVRMTFETPKPFFPYREPVQEVHNEQQRLLRIFFLAKKRMQGTLGKKLWPGKVVWANKLNKGSKELLLQRLNLPLTTPPVNWFLTEFEDYSSPRPGSDDVYFSISKNQSPVERPPITQYVYTGHDAGFYLVILFIVFPKIMRRRRRQKHS
ncbi:DUF2330 domain-containing protein [Candidatus Uabimicrobium amorphum]|uniref:DUF2330 domain-containing protein n=1 Tax=Uabimicrobium amorphum TaxID=2596890 RepID=A0A5S9INJ3_UABAM|nr:DUF2330 domain-containing protein [Candidatus Uabimicrobium amorphum]BBM85139.1 hypothetical protein UABAM_03502 [Candidatus Uabimicrobium amorphum]